MKYLFTLLRNRSDTPISEATLQNYLSAQNTPLMYKYYTWEIYDSFTINFYNKESTPNKSFYFLSWGSSGTNYNRCSISSDTSGNRFQGSNATNEYGEVEAADYDAIYVKPYSSGTIGSFAVLNNEQREIIVSDKGDDNVANTKLPHIIMREKGTSTYITANIGEYFNMLKNLNTTSISGYTVQPIKVKGQNVGIYSVVKDVNANNLDIGKIFTVNNKRFLAVHECVAIAM